MMDKAIPPLVLAIVGAAVAWAFSPSMAARPAMLAILAGAYAPLLALSLYRMWRDGTLLDLFRFRSGDLTLGVGIAAFLGACCWLGRTLVAPRGSPADMLVMRVYVQLGEVPADRSTYALVALALVFVAIADEIVWRGLVQQVLEERWGVRAGWLGTAGLYALAHAPTIWLLGVPGSPRNPLVVTAALFCGVVWGFAVGRMQRLPPAILSHAALTFLLAMQFRLWAPGLAPIAFGGALAGVGARSCSCRASVWGARAGRGERGTGIADRGTHPVPRGPFPRPRAPCPAPRIPHARPARAPASRSSDQHRPHPGPR